LLAAESHRRNRTGETFSSGGFKRELNQMRL